MTVHIRPATPADAPALATLLTQLGYPSPAEDIPRRLATLDGEGNAAALVAERNNRVVGLVTVNLHFTLALARPIAEVTSLVVAEEARVEGVGRRLADAAEAFARAQGCGRVYVTSAEHRAGAHAFYQHIGWAYTGRRFAKTIG